MSLFIVCGQGLEEELTKELTKLGHKDITPGYCGVYVKDQSMKTVYEINYRSRLASRVLLPLLDFRCDNKEHLYQKSLAFEWERYFTPDYSLAIDANVQHPSLRNSLFAAQVLKDAICDRLRDTKGFRPTIELKNPDLQLNLFIDEGRAIISFDTSGQPLHKRNYRLHTGPAPMQETLAATLLQIASYNENEITIDPCCGSGTLLIEAALMATKTPPGYLRTQWGFYLHPDFNEQLWQKVKQEADAQKLALKPGMFWGLERESEIADFCRSNIKRAGFADGIEIICTNFMDHTPKAPYSFLITNPPHGNRLGNEDALKPIYKALGDFMKQKMNKPSRAFVYTSSKILSKSVGLATKRRHIMTSGALDARLLEFDIY